MTTTKLTTSEEKIIIGLTFLFSCVTIPLMHSRLKRLQNLPANIQKKVKTVNILQFACFALVLLKIFIQNIFKCTDDDDPKNAYIIEIVNLISMIGLIVSISILNGIWWEFYYTSFAYFGRTYMSIFLISIVCLAWIPLALKNTFFPDELMRCLERIRLSDNKKSKQKGDNRSTSKKMYPPLSDEDKSGTPPVSTGYPPLIRTDDQADLMRNFVKNIQ